MIEGLPPAGPSARLALHEEHAQRERHAEADRQQRGGRVSCNRRCGVLCVDTICEHYSGMRASERGYYRRAVRARLFPIRGKYIYTPRGI